MAQSKLKLVVHPVRLRILQQLTLKELTTKQLCEFMPDVPQSSVYRHLSLLLKGGMITVTDTNPVRGIEEKVYALAQSPRITSDDEMGGIISAEEHLRYFTIFATTLIEGFSRYIHAETAPDLRTDGAGYTETLFYATNEEMTAAIKALNTVLVSLIQQEPGPGRRQRKFSVVTHPVDTATKTSKKR